MTRKASRRGHSERLPLAEPQRVPAISRTEWIVLALLVLLAVVLRLAFPSRLEIEHFDEGVYASNLWFPAELGGQYPLRQLYAPPLLPALIESALILNLSVSPSGPVANWAPFVPSLLAGCATVPLLWWIGRTWFGPGAGIATATLATFSDLHVLYSRTALTEPWLVFLLAAALWLIERAIRTRTIGNIAFAAIASGLAWWTKYNGWLALAISLSGLITCVIWRRREQSSREVMAEFSSWGAIAVAAFLTWCPYLSSLQEEGGYASIAANHRQYVVGVSGWVNSFTRQADNLRHHDSWLTCLGLAAAICVAGWLSERRNRWMRVGFAFVVAGIGAVAGSMWVLGALGIVGIISILNRGDALQSRLASCILAVWFVGLFVATPLYHPYPRLMLPWLGAVWLAAGCGSEQCLKWIGEWLPTRAQSVVGGIGCVVSLCLLLTSATRLIDTAVPAWQSRTGLAEISRQIVARIREQESDSHDAPEASIVYVVGEPGLVYHLRAQGLPLVAPVDRVSTVAKRPAHPGFATWLVTGPHAHRDGAFNAEVAQAGEHLQLHEIYSYQPSDLVLLDHHSARRLGDSDVSLGEEVRLFWVQ